MLTPADNNRLVDLQHMIELSPGEHPDRSRTSASIVSPAISGTMESSRGELARKGSGDDSVRDESGRGRRRLQRDALFHAIVVQRSRAYVCESQKKQGSAVALFREA